MSSGTVPQVVCGGGGGTGRTAIVGEA